MEWKAPERWNAYVGQHGGDRASWLRLGVASLLARLIGESSFDVAWRHPSWSGETAEFGSLFLEAVPFRVDLDFGQDLAGPVRHLAGGGREAREEGRLLARPTAAVLPARVDGRPGLGERMPNRARHCGARREDRDARAVHLPAVDRRIRRGVGVRSREVFGGRRPRDGGAADGLSGGHCGRTRS